MDRKEAINILAYNAINATGKLGALPPTARKARYLNEQIKALNMAIEALQEPEIVHCKDCRHWDKEIMYCNHTGMQIEPDGYCVYGERKE